MDGAAGRPDDGEDVAGVVSDVSVDMATSLDEPPQPATSARLRDAKRAAARTAFTLDTRSLSELTRAADLTFPKWGSASLTTCR